MSAEWDRITDLFGAARLLESANRSAFLDLACAGDNDLRAQLEAMLSADAVEDTFLSAPPHDAVAEALRERDRSTLQGAILKDRYVVEEPIGAGGQALVYRATDRTLSRSVVVKVMRASPWQNAALKARFERERIALSRIDHPSVVGILDVGELDDGAPFIVMQYINGTSVRELLERGPVEAPQAAAIIGSVAAALSAAHAAGVAHQDLKPENVMVQRLSDGTETLKLIDFGIAKIDRSSLSPAITTVSIAGSLRYMAPEQFEGRNLPASDVYALGLLACELLFGQPDIRALPRNAGPALRHLLETATAFRPEDRPLAINEWAEELAGALTSHHPSKRLVRGAAVVALAILVTSIALAVIPKEADDDRIIEKVGGFDPVTEGFQVNNDLLGKIVANRDRTGFIGWSVITRESGGAGYFRPLTDSQKEHALARGWLLSVLMQVSEGGGSANIDFGDGKRFDINVLTEPDGLIVRLNTQLVPLAQGLEMRLTTDPSAYHKYELRYDGGLQTADLWIDGVKRISGYPGHNQFAQDFGLTFGSAPYKSDRGVASFQSVRFEINP